MCAFDILDKERSIKTYVDYMLTKTSRMFDYDGLPETIPPYMFEVMLQVYGTILFFEHNGEYYISRCEQGGPPDVYYRPTQAVVANVALNLSDTFRIVNNLPPFEKVLWEKMPPGVIVRNDSMSIGMIPMYSRYATQQAENDVSIRSAQINSREQTVICAASGPEIESANQYIKDLIAGRLSSIQKKAFVEGITIMNANQGNTNVITQLLDLQQYLKASWYNEIGLNSNFNMKSQYMSTDEVNSSSDMMLPLVDDMLECRKAAIDAINSEFNLNISIKKASAWAIKQAESKIPLVESGIDTPDILDDEIEIEKGESEEDKVIDREEGEDTGNL